MVSDGLTSHRYCRYRQRTAAEHPRPSQQEQGRILLLERIETEYLHIFPGLPGRTASGSERTDYILHSPNPASGAASRPAFLPYTTGLSHFKKRARLRIAILFPPKSTVNKTAAR